MLGALVTLPHFRTGVAFTGVQVEKELGWKDDDVDDDVDVADEDDNRPAAEWSNSFTARQRYRRKKSMCK